MSDQYQLMTEREAAALLRVAPGTLRVRRCTDATKSGIPQIPCVRIGRTVRYRRVDLEQFIRENTKGGAES